MQFLWLKMEVSVTVLLCFKCVFRADSRVFLGCLVLKLVSKSVMLCLKSMYANGLSITMCFEWVLRGFVEVYHADFIVGAALFYLLVLACFAILLLFACGFESCFVSLI